MRLVIATLLVLASSVLAQHQPPSGAQRDAMKKLDFLVGTWKGESWIEMMPGQRSTAHGTETIQSKLDGLLLSIDGLHMGKRNGTGPDVVIHNAFAIVYYDLARQQYRFEGFTTRGNRVECEAMVSENQLTWSMKIPNFGDVKYTIKLDEKGHWFEIGEVSADGKEWRKFFEMTLERVKPG